MERLRCCHCGKFMKFENATMEQKAKKIGFRNVYSIWEISEVLYFHNECDKKVKEYKQLLNILDGTTHI